MHVCLLPTEILLHIFAINDEENYSSRPFLARLAVLARTCKKFKEPALDILWKHIDGFKPLISCLPEGISSTDRRGNLTLQRPLLAGEWRLMDQYARRVRSFTVTGPQLDMIKDHVMQALMSAPSPTSFLPNLRSLRWCDDRRHFFPLLRIFLGSTITSMQLGFKSTSPSFAQSALLASLGGRCPSIRQLDCVCVGDSAGSSDAIYNTLSGLRDLSHLDTGALSPRNFLRLASLPSLKSLFFRLGTYDIHEIQSNSAPTNFPKLEGVYLTTSSQSVVEHFLRTIRLPSCRSAKVSIDYNDLYFAPEIPYDPLHIPDLIVSLSKCFSPALEKLDVDFDFDLSTYIGERLIANRSYVLGFSAVVPLLPFNRLTDIRLDWLCTSAINDASLKILVQSWPQLEQFYFGGGACWLVPPSMTFTALVHLIQHCPHLHAVQMSFCATQVDYDYENDPFFSETIPNEKITTLSVGMSPISRPCAVAYLLFRLLPKLQYVEYLGWLDVTPAPPPFEHVDDGWSMVNEFLAVNNPRELT